MSNSPIVVKKHTQANTDVRTGDCYSTSIACLLGVERSEVPTFIGPGIESSDEQRAAAREFLRTRGLGLFSFLVAASTPQEAMIQVHASNPEAFYILSGMSARNSSHSVICKGREFYHDVHPSRSFLVAPYANVFEVELITVLHGEG